MLYDYGIIVDRQQPNCVRSGEYNGMASPYRPSDDTAGNFVVMRNHANRERILEIDDRLIAANEEYRALSGSLSTASDAVKGYIEGRIVELKNSLSALELERSRLLAVRV